MIFKGFQKVFKRIFTYIIIDIMPDYSQGKIYRIWDNNFTKCYIGSTVQPLSKRMEGHRSDYKKYLKQETRNVRVFHLFDEFGVENCKIELLETYPCNDKEELFAREGHHQRECECVNKQVSGRNQQQYYEDNKEEILNQKKQYYFKNQEEVKQKRKEYVKTHKAKVLAKDKKYREEHKEQIQKKRKEHYNEHKDEISEYQRTYYENNETKIKNRLYEKVVCCCGTITIKGHKARHEKTLKHQQYLKSLEETN